MPSIFPKTDKEGKQLASAKDEQTHFLSVCFGAWSFSCCQHTGSLSANSNSTQVTWFWTNPLGCNTKKPSAKKVLMLRKFLITTLTASQSGSTIKEGKDRSAMQSALLEMKNKFFSRLKCNVSQPKDVLCISVEYVKWSLNIYLDTLSRFYEPYNLWPIEKFLQPVLHKMLLKVFEYDENWTT